MSEAATGTQAWLLVNNHDQTRDHIRLTLALTTVGRSEQNVIEVLDPKLSRFHFEIERHASGYTLRDCNSRNGTLVNGELARGQQRLVPGDRIKAGRTVFTFLDQRPDDMRSDPVVEIPPVSALEADASEETLLASSATDDTPHMARRRPTAKSYDRRPTTTLKAPHGLDPWRLTAEAGLKILDAKSRGELLEQAVERASQFFQAKGAMLALGNDPDALSITASIGIEGDARVRCLDTASRVLTSRGCLFDDRRVVGVPIRGRSDVQGALVLHDLAGAVGEDSKELDALQTLADIVGRTITTSLLLEEVRREERTAGARRIAHDLRNVLRPLELAPVPGLEVSRFSIPGEDVGLDFWDRVDGPERAGRREVYFAIGDVPDDAAPPSVRLRRRGERSFVSLLGQTELRGALRAMVEVTPRTSDLLAGLNRALRRDATVPRMALLLARYDTKDGLLRFAGAGHMPVLIRRADGTVESIEALAGPLGLEAELKVAERDLGLARDDQVLFVTSGVQRLDRVPSEEREGLGSLFERLGGVAHPVDEVARRIAEALVQLSVGRDQDSLSLLLLRKS